MGVDRPCGSCRQGRRCCIGAASRRMRGSKDGRRRGSACRSSRRTTSPPDSPATLGAPPCLQPTHKSPSPRRSFHRSRDRADPRRCNDSPPTPTPPSPTHASAALSRLQCALPSRTHQATKLSGWNATRSYVHSLYFTDRLMSSTSDITLFLSECLMMSMTWTLARILQLTWVQIA